MQVFSLKKFNGLLLLFIVLIIYSCKKEEIDNPVPEEEIDSPVPEEVSQYQNVNEWIQDNMNLLYLWNTQIPEKTDLTLYPSDFFKSLLYTEEDRFSFIAEDFAELTNLLNGVQMEAGYDYSLGYADKEGKNVFGIINYIKPHSSASLTDLKRGDIFLTINGIQLTVDNYQELTDEMSAPHTLGVYRDGSIQSISLTVDKYEENPVLLDSIYEMGGEKIAYLIYNFFASDNGDYSYSYLKELNDIFGKFKQANVSDMVLDLRYDTGGEADVATSLASMISGRSSNDLFCVDQYNSTVDTELKKELGSNYNKTFFDDYLIIRDENGTVINQSTPVNKLAGLQRLYVLTSQRTASASELIINGLKPYMDVILVGDTTYGKNVGMWFIYETDPQKQKDNRWGMLPIVFKIYNSKNQSDYSKGFNPDMNINEYAGEILPLGDTNESLLGAALVDMGVQSGNTFRSAKEKFDFKPLMTSVDRTPVRKNIYRKIP